MCFWLRPSFPIVHITCFCNVMLLLLPSPNHQINQHSSSQIKIAQKMIASLFLEMAMMMLMRNFCVAPLKCEKVFLCMPHYNFVDCSLTSQHSQMVTYCLRLNIPLVFALNSSRFMLFFSFSSIFFFIISLLLFCTQLSSAQVNEHERMADKRYTRHIKCALENSNADSVRPRLFFSKLMKSLMMRYGGFSANNLHSFVS